jgi:hypothetical protein
VPSDTHAFIVRIWPEALDSDGNIKTWRGSIEHVGNGQRLHFCDLGTGWVGDPATRPPVAVSLGVDQRWDSQSLREILMVRRPAGRGRAYSDQPTLDVQHLGHVAKPPAPFGGGFGSSEPEREATKLKDLSFDPAPTPSHPDTKEPSRCPALRDKGSSSWRIWAIAGNLSVVL